MVLLEPQDEVSVRVTPKVAGVWVMLWLHWAKIAVTHAEYARHAAERQDGEKLPLGYDSGEITNSMIAVSAAAQFLDGLFGSLEAHIKDKKGKPRDKWILERLKRGFVIDEEKEQEWASDFEWLLGLRNAAAHHTQKMREPVEHPRGKEQYVSREEADYSAESAETAARIIEDVLRTLPNSTREVSRPWIDLNGSAIEVFLSEHAFPSPAEELGEERASS